MISGRHGRCTPGHLQQLRFRPQVAHWSHASCTHRLQVTQEEYNSFFKSSFKEFLDPAIQTHFSVEGTLEFSALLYVPGMAPFEETVRPHCTVTTFATCWCCRHCPLDPSPHQSSAHCTADLWPNRACQTAKLSTVCRP